MIGAIRQLPCVMGEPAEYESNPQASEGGAFELEARIHRVEGEEAEVSVLGPSRRCCLNEPFLDGE